LCMSHPHALQAVYTVDLEQRTVGLTNPKRKMHEEDLLNSLPSPAMLLVRANEVLMHAVNMTDEEILEVEWPNSHWNDMGVTRQVLELRERYRGDSWPDAKDEFISVPYAGTVKAQKTQQQLELESQPNHNQNHNHSHSHSHNHKPKTTSSPSHFMSPAASSLSPARGFLLCVSECTRQSSCTTMFVWLTAI